MESKEKLKKWLKDNDIQRNAEQIEKIFQEHEEFSKALFHIMLDRNGHFMGVRDQTTKPWKDFFINKDAKAFIRWVEDQAYITKDFSANHVKSWSNGKLIIVFTNQSYDQRNWKLIDDSNEAEETKNNEKQ